MDEGSILPLGVTTHSNTGPFRSINRASGLNLRSGRGSVPTISRAKDTRLFGLDEQASVAGTCSLALNHNEYQVGVHEFFHMKDSARQT